MNWAPPVRKFDAPVTDKTLRSRDGKATKSSGAARQYCTAGYTGATEYRRCPYGPPGSGKLQRKGVTLFSPKWYFAYFVDQVIDITVLGKWTIRSPLIMSLTLTKS